MKCERKRRKKMRAIIIYKNCQCLIRIESGYHWGSEWLLATALVLSTPPFNPFIQCRSMSGWTQHINNLTFNLNVNYAANATGCFLVCSHHYIHGTLVRCQCMRSLIFFVNVQHNLDRLNGLNVFTLNSRNSRSMPFQTSEISFVKHSLR